MNLDINRFDHYCEKTWAGWLGKIIGIRLGAPVEGWLHKDIYKRYGEINGYLVDYSDFAADDDSNGPLFFVRALIDADPIPADISELKMSRVWLDYVPDHHGFFWWGGYGVSSEQTAYENLRSGIPAPRSGSRELNGPVCSEQIGGQIFSECWGFTHPGDPVGAAHHAELMARVSHDGIAVHGGMFIAACVSLAYTAMSIKEIVRDGLDVIPADSAFALLVHDIIAFHEKDTTADWMSCFRYIQETYGYDKYPGNCHIIPNAAIVVLSLLYGNGDFTRSLCICTMCGWDTDCNAGNVGAIVGIHTGIDRIDERWISPINDLLIASSVIGGMNIDTVSGSTQRFCRLGYKLAGIEPPKKWAKRFSTDGKYFNFDLPKSTGAFRVRKGGGTGGTVTMSNVQYSVAGDDTGLNQDGHRFLRFSVRDVDPQESVEAYIKTYYQPSDLHDSRYDPAFTPTVFPGQIVRFRALSPDSRGLDARIVIHDRNSDRCFYSEVNQLGGALSMIEFHIPRMEGVLIDRLGLIVRPRDRIVDYDVFIEGYGVFGTPDYLVDFSKERQEHFGYTNGKPHIEISQFTYMNGLWELHDGCLSGSCAAEGEAYTGDFQVTDYMVDCRVKPMTGWHHLMNVRVRGASSSYAFGFFGRDTVALLKKNLGYSVVASKEFPYVLGREYGFRIEVKGSRITAGIEGKVLFTWDDLEGAYAYGQWGFTVLQGSHCHYQDLSVSPV